MRSRKKLVFIRYRLNHMHSFMSCETVMKKELQCGVNVLSYDCKWFGCIFDCLSLSLMGKEPREG